LSEQFQPPDQPPHQPPYGAPPLTSQIEGNVWKGFGLALLLQLLQIPIGLALSLFDSGAFLGSIIFIGVSQLVYMIPAIVIAAGKGLPHIVKGLIIGAAVVFLLNAACAGVVFYSLSQGSFH
jgi:hypothetical protein